MSAGELAERAEMKPSAVRRHLREMRTAGVVEIVDLRSRRNMAEQVYRARKDFILTKEDRAGQTAEERRRFDAYTLKVVIGEALRSIVSREARRSSDEADECVTRIPMHVDEEGWAELAGAHEEFFFRVMELRDRIEKRTQGEGKVAPIRATSFILFFEVSPPR
jgi:DNA-binding transcriptional ArsR family regulator